MNKVVKKVLIVGGGFSGMSAAIELSKRGIDVHLVEIDKGWRSYGAGLSLAPPTLRVFRTLGIIDQFLELGYGSNEADLYTADGTLMVRMPSPRLAGDDVPSSGAIMRPVLASILSKATRAAGTKVTLGETFKSIEQDANGVNVTFTNGESDRYDMVVGADGLFSSVRKAVFPDAPEPAFTEQGVWRAVVDTPPEIKFTTIWIASKIKVGINPVSKTQSYIFVTADQPTKERIDEKEYLWRFKKLLEPFTAPTVVKLREDLNENNAITYRPLESLLLPRPWHRGRVVLIGDAVHATTPHLASGACIGMEDSVVLAEELDREGSIDERLKAFEDRRWERCRLVVENSLRLLEIEVADGDKKEHAHLARDSMIALAAPI